MPTPSLLYQADARPFRRFGSLRPQFPLSQQSPQQLLAEAFEADFECVLQSAYAPAPKNTPSTAAPFTLPRAVSAAALASGATAILTGWTQPSPSGASMGKFAATFNIVPANWDDFKTMPFTFPGFIGIIGSADSRDIQTAKVTTRLHYDYFLIDPDSLAAGVKDSAGAAIMRVDSMGDIPRISKNYFVNTSAGEPVFNSHINSLVPSAGITINNTTYTPTFPTIERFKNWIANAAPFFSTKEWTPAAPPIWNGETDDNTAGQIVADDSWLEPFAGNIIARITPYVLVI